MHLRVSWRFTGYWLGFFCWLSITTGPMASAVYAEQGFRFLHLCSTVTDTQYYDMGVEPDDTDCHCLWTMVPADESLLLPAFAYSPQVGDDYRLVLQKTLYIPHPRAPPAFNGSM